MQSMALQKNPWVIPQLIFGGKFPEMCLGIRFFAAVDCGAAFFKPYFSNGQSADFLFSVALWTCG